MNKFLLALCIACSSFNFYAQEKPGTATGTSAIDPRIAEVFGNQLTTLVLNDKDRRKGLEDILNIRTKINEVKFTPGEKIPKLSSMPLFNKYNPNLKRDEVFDAATFNVLKYNLHFFAQYTQMYRIDNTDYVIVILPQNTK
jgi:hypothetical protein